MRHNIIGSESLGRRTFAPGYGAMRVPRRVRRFRLSKRLLIVVAVLVLVALVLLGSRIAPLV